MKLSEAIRLGGMSHPKIIGDPFHFDNNGVIVGTCAVGSALVAIGKAGVGNNRAYPSLLREFPWLSNPGYVCPVCGSKSHTLEVIWHLNDIHDWTRESIADWVTTIEEQMATPGTNTEVAEEVMA